MKNKQTLYCQECNLPLFLVDHYEVDGEDGSHEPYFECPNGCEEPLEDRVETYTEFDTVKIYKDYPLSFII